MTTDDAQAIPAVVATARAKIVEAAKTQLGVPYRYGLEDPGIGFDCSGLAQWSCGQANIPIPRGSAAQFSRGGPRVAPPLEPGMLVFFYGGEPSGPRPGHVGIVTGPSQMIDAPYSGTVVRYDTIAPGNDGFIAGGRVVP